MIASIAFSKLSFESSSYASLTEPHRSFSASAEATLSSYWVDSKPVAITSRMAGQLILAKFGMVDSKLSQTRLETDLIRLSSGDLYRLTNIFGIKRLIVGVWFSPVVSNDSGKALSISFKFITLMISNSGSRSARLSKSYLTVFS